MQYGPLSGISFRRDALCGFYAKCQVVELTAKAASYNQLSLQALLCLFKCYGSLQTKWESQALLTAESCRTDFGQPSSELLHAQHSPCLLTG